MKRKAFQIKFYDNDFVSAAFASLNGLNTVLDLTKESEEDILREFKFFIHQFSNINVRFKNQGYHYTAPEYFNKCTIESFHYIPKEWFNSESLVYNIETGEVTIL